MERRTGYFNGEYGALHDIGIEVAVEKWTGKR